MKSIFSPFKFWFQKRQSALDATIAEREQRAKFNALLKSDPADLQRAVSAFDAGTLGPLAHLIEAYELRDDKMKVCSMKMKAAAARCDYEILPREGYEDDPRAKLHVEILRRFWSGVHATHRFRRNERGGFSLLVKQLMDAQSYGFAVDEIVWKPLPGGELSAEFIQIPLWHFENHTGELRFLPTNTAFEGEAMRPGEWLVHTGDGIGIAASIVACLKRMGLADWMVFCERCGMPIIHAKTGAAFGSEQWNNLKKAIAAIGRDARIQTDRDTDLAALATGGGAAQPYTPLIEWADRSIAALYRGADLSTISQGGDALGASLQGEEAALIEQDSCNRLSETLHEQVDAFVIRYCTSDPQPLATIAIQPAKRPNVDEDIKIDQHLSTLGVQLSKSDALQRYGRTEASDEADALVPRASSLVPGSVPEAAAPGFPTPDNAASPASFAPATALPNEQPQIGGSKGLKIAPDEKDAQLPPSAETAPESKKNAVSSLGTAFEALIADSLAEAMTATLAPTAPETEDEPEERIDLANEECRAEIPAKCPFHGTPENKLLARQENCRKALAAYKASKDHPSVDDILTDKTDIRSALKKGFEAEFGGQKVIFFTQSLGDKYDGRGEHGRVDMIKHVLGVRSSMFPVNHPGEQIGLVERPAKTNAGNRHVVTADRDTGIVQNVMRCSDAYIKKHYK